MAIGLDLSVAERDALLVAFGYKPVGTDPARRSLDEAAEHLGLSAAKRAELLADAGLPPDEDGRRRRPPAGRP